MPRPSLPEDEVKANEVRRSLCVLSLYAVRADKSVVVVVADF